MKISRNIGSIPVLGLSIVLLSGCLETLQPLAIKPTANPAAGAPDKTATALPAERSLTPTAKPLPAEPKPVPARPTVQGTAASTKPQSSSYSKGKEISCTPDVVRPGDTLVIKTNKAYPALGVRVPDKNVQFILLVAGMYPEGLMDSDKFARQMGMDINVAEAKVKPNTRVFTKEGVYGFVVSRNLETDDGTPSFECKVRYSTK